mmetsp:Transcript_2181/g.4631  ORF Transcript_2181/g.4631 Transcript_2181/m.4631 type:complete len:369 (-) Transcript_2181:53-1159(-)|eukprot:CAMPEP_0206543458 /NCGR_PEP_ID=MMETSP0325_2-20121206/10880_1 /ASSEMBLY_ACC=CAM_ASM_000347 /TAXON_ID=2866 /ORGANISM="Crypthecodinium cohnii, Strain Seligo" /LENGTH=368 /DNA_ID=CAMNT_0054041911 /DNA_START=177 /DNA_END=1283 /DNA_ORIENTATION=-
MRDLHAAAFALLAAFGVLESAAGDTGCSSSSSPSLILDSFTEREVELVEEEVAADLRFELLQRDLQRTKAIQTPGEQQQKGAEAALPEALSLAASESQHRSSQSKDSEKSEQSLEHLESKDLEKTDESEVSESDSESESQDFETDDEAEEDSIGLEDPEAPAVDCEKYPVFCDPKVNCAANPVSKDERSKWGKKLATDDGHANPRSWCMVYPLYAVSLSKCIVEDDKTTYAQMMYEDQSKAGLSDADAVYCFVSGHCNNTKVNINTTMAESEQICEELYEEHWKSVGWEDFMGVVARARDTMAKDKKALEAGTLNWSDMMALAKREATISAMTACAMGNFQCDVFYCKANYCENDSYKKQFGNMSWPL